MTRSMIPALVLVLAVTPAPAATLGADAAAQHLADAYREQAERYDAGGERGPDPAAVFRPRFIEHAKTHAGTDDAIAFLAMAVECTPDAETRAVLIEETLAAHVRSARLTPLIVAMRTDSRSLGADRLRGYIETILRENVDPGVNAEAMLSRALLVYGDAPAIEEPTSQEVRTARIDLRRAVQLSRKAAETGAVAGRAPVAPDVDLTAEIERTLQETLGVEVGRVAPDIVGRDLDGVAFRLSDYRGRVVVLDFWGDW